MQKLGWLWRVSLALKIMVRKNYSAFRRIEAAHPRAATTREADLSEAIA